MLSALYFDGECKEIICGCGAWIRLENNDHYHIHWNGGLGTNNKVEIMALWSGVHIYFHLNLSYIHIYGDSKIRIDGINDKTEMKINNCVGRVQRIRYLLGNFHAYNIQHIYRENNTWADFLSKRGLECTYGAMQINHYKDSSLLDSQSLSIP